jgi:hypothetical protein
MRGVNCKQEGISAMVNTVTASLLGSVLGTPAVRNLFTLVANRRIAEKATLPKANDPDVKAALVTLESADLINLSRNGEKYFVTAKGLKVARDLEKIPF